MLYDAVKTSACCVIRSTGACCMTRSKHCMLFSDGKTSVCCVMRLRQCTLGDEDKTGASCVMRSTGAFCVDVKTSLYFVMRSRQVHVV